MNYLENRKTGIYHAERKHSPRLRTHTISGLELNIRNDLVSMRQSCWMDLQSKCSMGSRYFFREKNKIKNASFLDIGSCSNFPTKFVKHRFWPSPCVRFCEAWKFFKDILWVKHHGINSLGVNRVSRSDTYSFRDFGPGQREFVGIMRNGWESRENIDCVYPFGTTG